MLPVKLTKTPVGRVECYYLGGPAGTIELHYMHMIDYDEAFAAHPDNWVLAEDYKLNTGPTAPKIIDKRDLPVFPTPQQLSSSGPPVLDAALTMNQVKRKIRTGALGAP